MNLARHAKWRATPQSARQCCALLLEFSMPDLIVCLQELENQVNKRLFFLQQKGKESWRMSYNNLQYLPKAYLSNICMPSLRQYKVYHSNGTFESC